MSNLLQIPGSVPWWLVLIAIIPLGIYALMLLAMPFSVFGLKGRMDAIEARLDDMHADIRSVLLLHPNGTDGAQDRDAMGFAAPPIAPIRASGTAGSRSPAPGDSVPPRRLPPDPGTRAEPRLTWPK